MFQFKQFVIDDTLCAQKIGTDGVLLGAWTPLPPTTKYILDIGTGSGLIALMLAQRINNLQSKIHAIDIDENAVQQANKNFINSPWQTQLQAYHTNLQNYQPKTPYNLMVANPPYFENALKSSHQNRNTARHNDELPLQNLFLKASLLLAQNGIFSIIYPYEKYDTLKQLAVENKLQVNVITKVKGNINAPIKRVLMSFTKTTQKIKSVESELIIEESRNIYTSTYKKLTQEFYLKF